MNGKELKPAKGKTILFGEMKGENVKALLFGAMKGVDYLHQFNIGKLYINSL